MINSNFILENINIIFLLSFPLRFMSLIIFVYSIVGNLNLLTYLLRVKIIKFIIYCHALMSIH